MPKILLVEDDHTTRYVLKTGLVDAGNEVVEASNGQEALDVYSEVDDIDLILTDLVMPEMCGIDLIMEIRTQAPDLKIIALSSGGGISGRFDYLPIAQMVGADMIMTKPFSLSAVCDSVTSLLNDDVQI